MESGRAREINLRSCKQERDFGDQAGRGKGMMKGAIGGGEAGGGGGTVRLPGGKRESKLSYGLSCRIRVPGTGKRRGRWRPVTGNFGEEIHWVQKEFGLDWDESKA